MLFPFWLNQRMKGDFPAWTRKEQIPSILAGVFLGLHFTSWIASLSFTSIASASVLVTIHPILLIIVESFMRTSKFRAITWAGVIIAFMGSALMAFSESDPAVAYANPLFGNFLAVAAAVFFVGYLMLSRSLRQKARWLDFIFRVYAGTALTCVVLFLGMGLPLTAAPIAVLCGIGLAIGPQIIGHGSVNYSVKFVNPTLLATLILTEPVFAIILAIFIFGENPTIIEIASMLVIMGGIVLAWVGGTVKK